MTSQFRNFLLLAILFPISPATPVEIRVSGPTAQEGFRLRSQALAHAQAADTAQTELEQLITALQSKYDKLTTLAADFTPVYHAPGERVRREGGRLLLKKPGRMRWDYTTPESKLFVSDCKWLYEYV